MQNMKNETSVPVESFVNKFCRANPIKGLLISTLLVNVAIFGFAVYPLPAQYPESISAFFSLEYILPTLANAVALFLLMFALAFYFAAIRTAR